jgi:hypothetical protein
MLRFHCGDPLFGESKSPGRASRGAAREAPRHGSFRAIVFMLYEQLLESRVGAESRVEGARS